jgi:hypothetical protein
VILSCGDPWAGTGFALILDGRLRPALVQAPNPSQPLTCGAGLETGTWSVVLAALGGAGPAQLAAGPLAGDPGAWPGSVTGRAGGPPSPALTGDLVLGAVRAPWA